MQVWTGKLSELQLPVQNPAREGACTSMSYKDRDRRTELSVLKAAESQLKIYSWWHDEFRISVRQANWSQVLFKEMADYSGQVVSHM